MKKCVWTMADRFVRLYAVLLLLLMVAKSAEAQNEPITLKCRNVSLLAAMDSIRQHSNYRFSYNLSLVPLLQQTRVSITFKNDPIEKVLSMLFFRKGIKYRVQDYIILLSKDESPQPAKPAPAMLMQSVKGKVTDKESHAPLANVSITVIQAQETRGTMTDSNGLFSLKIPVGRQSLQCTFVGYQKYIAGDIQVISGKETFLTIEMQETGEKMEAVTVQAERRDRPLNAMATVSNRVLTMEDALKYAGGFNDPARMVNTFAGVSSGGGSRNNLIIRGNSPTGLLWKLEGIEIPNPNHFTQGQGDGGGIFSIISADMLADFDFFTGAFPAEYGNAFSGILDLNLRKGNPDKTEYGVQAGFIGTQVSVEGPISKSKKSSYLLNYRYGNLQFLNSAGIIDLDENEKPPVFQDFSMHVNLPTAKAGNFSIFAIGGTSESGKYPLKDSMNRFPDPDLHTDLTEYRQMGVLGLKHTLLLPNKKTYLKSILSASWQSDRYVRIENNNSVMIDSNRYTYPTIRFATTLDHKFSTASVIRTGIIYNQFFFSVFGRRKMNQGTANQEYLTYVDQQGNTGSAEGFFQWKYRLWKRMEINSGLHATYFLLNQNFVLEPRFSAKWRMGNNAAVSYGFGLHSRIAPISLYFAKVKTPAGDITQPNLNLQLTRAMHHVLGYEIAPAKNLRIKAEIYYQYLYKVPVIDDTNSVYSILNTLNGIGDSAYVNKGKGYNKGIELTLEKLFSQNYYVLVTGSLFDSKYKPANGKKYNTYFNTRYQANLLAGKDFITGHAKQHIFSLNVKAIVHGGFRYSPLRTGTNSNGSGYSWYPIEETYTGQAPQYVRFDAGFKFRKNNRRYSWILSLDVQNVANRENILSYEFRANSNNIVYTETTDDLGIVPILNLKVEF
jgi:hypothetical protein